MQQQYDKVHAHIIQKINLAQGTIPFAEFMQLALYAPGLGYYSAGSYKIGALGDFITAPELSPLFSYCLAEQCAQILSDSTSSSILELGAGSGKMAGDLLTHLQRLNHLPQQYFILEVSADLKERQQHYLSSHYPTLFERIIWLEQLPTQFAGIILANEVMDAMPVHLFHWDKTLQELAVTQQNDQFTWQLIPPTAELLNAFNTLQNDLIINPWHIPYISEINLLLPAWIASLAHCLQQGVILLIDYGFPRHEYYHPQRNTGTLMCHYQHQAHTDPLLFVGLQDITAHVDFTAVAESAIAAGLVLDGFTTQANFLLNCHLLELAEQLIPPTQRLHSKTAIKKLTLPHEMGELFKVIGFSKNYSTELIGFGHNEMSQRL